MTINVSVELVGAGAGATVIRGAGPVLAIGTAGAESEPTVTIDGVTVTGGAAIGNLAPESGRGGGIYIPRAAGPSTGAAVTIRDSVIRGNRTAPAAAVESDEPCCPFADSGGGGISNDGALTVVDTADLRQPCGRARGGLASNAIGGGILNRAFGTLTVKRSAVTDNHVGVTPPNGRFAPGGGIAASGGQAHDHRQPCEREHRRHAFHGAQRRRTRGDGRWHPDPGRRLGDDPPNRRNPQLRSPPPTPVGDAVAFSGGVHADGVLVMRDSTVSHNRVVALTAPDRPATPTRPTAARSSTPTTRSPTHALTATP